MKKIVILIAILLAASLSVAGQKVHSSLSEKIDKELEKFDATTSIGILVQDKKTGKILYKKNADHFFMPASNEKLFTAFAALSYLGANFTYKTNLFVDTNKIKNGTLNDNIYFQFSGDPALTWVQLERMIHSLTQAGIQRINGNIIIDDSLFDQMGMSPGSTWDDKDFCWGSPVNAITVESNCVWAILTPGVHPGQPANMALPDYPQSLQFINQVMTGSGTESDCITHTQRTSPTTYTISGCISPFKQHKNIAMAINNPRANIQFLLDYLLKKNQITQTGQFAFHKIDAPPTLLAVENSPPLSSLVTTMLKNSDNMIANALFKTIGSVYTKESGSFQNGSDAVRGILAKSMKLDIPKTTLIDGAGGSRYDFLTPRQLVSLLQKINAYPQANLFMSALPISGIDGTLKARMKNSSAFGKVYAKTGTATAVSTLSGYLKTQRKHTLIFSIMVNGFVDLPDNYEDLQDKICATLVENA